MNLWTLIPAAAALLCLEVAVIFAILYARVSRRRADLAFSAFALCLALMRWASFMWRGSPTPDAALVWLRLEWVATCLALAALFHFVASAINEPLGRRGLALTGVMAVGLAAIGWSDSFFRLPAASVAVVDLEASAHGPLYPFLVPIPVLGALVAVVKLFTGTPRPGDTALSPLAHHRRHTLTAGLVLVLAPGLAVLGNHFLPGLRALSIQSLAAVAFCVIIGRALGKEVLRLESEKQRLAQLVEFRDAAVRDVAHELKNPLAAIQMATETLLLQSRQGLEATTQCQILELCLDACRRLMRLINNMLDTARLEAGRKLDLRLEETDIPALAQSILDLLQKTTLAHRLLLHSELPAPVLLLDPDKAHQVLTNLVHNAIKYSPDGGDVTVRLGQRDGHLLMEVSDQGIGMTPEQQARLFRPFERVVDPERRITGTGIGLHLVKRLVEAQGGEIRVESQPGVGSVFSVTLPCEPPAEVAEEPMVVEVA